MKLKIHMANGQPVPAYQSAGAAALDLTAAHHAMIFGGGMSKVGTGMHVAIPPGYYGQILGRSGLALSGAGAG